MFYPCLLLVGFYCPCSYWSVFPFFIPNTDSRKYANILLYYPHREGARQFPMHFHDVVGKSVVYYRIMKTPRSLLSAFMKKLTGLCRHHECGMLK
jgi:hypothetical protein